MQERHLNRDVYFNEQAYTTQQYVMPFIESVRPFKENLEVLEIGCGEGGNMLPFLDQGYHVTGIDLSSNKIKNAEKFYADHPKVNNLTLINEDIYDIDDQKQYDLIISGLIPRGSASEKWVQGSTLGFNTFYLS